MEEKEVAGSGEITEQNSSNGVGPVERYGDNGSAEVRSLLAGTLEATLLPVERFSQPETSRVVDIKQIGDTLGVLKVLKNKSGKSEYYGVELYFGSGKTFGVSLDLSNHDIASIYRRRQADVPIERSSFNTSVLKAGLRDDYKVAFSEEHASKLLNEWFSSKTCKELSFNTSSSVVYAGRINAYEEEFLNAGKWAMGVKLTEEGKSAFYFNGGGRNVVLDSEEQVVKGHRITSYSDEEIKGFKNPGESLPGGMILKEKDSLFTISDQNGQELANYQGIKPKLDPVDENTLYFLESGRIHKLDLRGVQDRTVQPVLEPQYKDDNLEELEFESNGNFLVVRSSEQKLKILDKDTGETIKEFDGIKGPIMVDKQEDILVVDEQDKLREIQTNFKAIPRGGKEEAAKRHQEELKKMQERFAELELKKVAKKQSDQVTEADVANTLRETISRQVAETGASLNPVEIEDALDRLQTLKADPSNQAYGEVVDEFIDQLRDRLSLIKTGEFEEKLIEYQKTLDDVKNVGDTMGLDQQFMKLLELRQKIDITDGQKRRDIEHRLRTLQEAKETVNNRYQGELVEAANQTLPQIKLLISETGSLQELNYFSTSAPAQQFELMLTNIKDPGVRRQLRDEFNGVRMEQRTKLNETRLELEEQERRRWAQIVGEAREELNNLKEQIEQMSDLREIDRFANNPLITAWRAKLYMLPPELREIEEKRLEIILGSKKKDMEHRKELGAVGEAGELKFGEAIFPVYKEPPVVWQPKLISRKSGFSQWADLVFEDSQGRVFKPGGEHDVVVVSDMAHEQTKGAIEKYQKEADEYFKGVKRQVPEFDEHWRITDYHKKKLEEVTEALNLQQDNHRGVLILQGEAGTGKNVMVDMLANLSNREVVTIACNENSVKEDLMYEFHYDPEKGTYKLPSKLVEAIQTPGAVILFDEINALKPGITKLLNSLFDYRRRLFISEGGDTKEIIVDPTVLFIGTMNPQNYAGINRLSPEVKSRSRVIDIDYPPFEDRSSGRTVYHSDEAEMLAGYMDTLSELKQEELKLCWNYVINRDTSNGADRILASDAQIEKDIERVFDVIKAVNRLREMYEAYQVGDSNEPMDFPVSLREATDIVMEMNHRQGVKEIFKRVVVPKIDDRRQKRMVEETIEAVLPEEWVTRPKRYASGKPSEETQ